MRAETNSGEAEVRGSLGFDDQLASLAEGAAPGSVRDCVFKTKAALGSFLPWMPCSSDRSITRSVLKGRKWMLSETQRGVPDKPREEWKGKRHEEQQQDRISDQAMLY